MYHPSAIPCPICGTPVEKGKLMCLRHWLMVPRRLQDQVNNAWRAVKVAKKPGVQLEALRRHRAAKVAAIDSVRAQVPAKEAA